MRVYCPAKFIRSGRILITDRGQIHHLADVLRLKEGDIIEVFDAQKEYECSVLKVSPKEIAAQIIKVNRQKAAPGVSVTLACAIPRKAKFDFIIEKCTELGISKIIPLITDRTIARPQAQEKLKRWQAITIEAARQSGRLDFPEIKLVQNFKEAIKYVKESDLALIPNLAPGNKHIKDVLKDFKGKSILVFIGPEGDFTKQEIELARKAGCIGISLGDLILKVDTACISIVSFLHLLL